MTNETTYRIEKADLKSNFTADYGPGYTMDDIKAVLKGYKKDELLSGETGDTYTRKGSRWIYFVTPDNF